MEASGIKFDGSFAGGRYEDSYIEGPQSRVWLFRGYGLDLQTHATLLRAILKQRCLALAFLLLSRLSNQLVDRRHNGNFRTILSLI